MMEIVSAFWKSFIVTYVGSCALIYGSYGLFLLFNSRKRIAYRKRRMANSLVAHEPGTICYIRRHRE